jgi:transcriptional regulator with XRE-family HTH domain
MGRKAVIVLPQTQRLLSQMGEQIRLARLRRHLPSELVAERAGVSRQTVTAIERGSASVSLGAYAKVLHALGGLEQDLLLVAKDDELGRKLQDLDLPQRQRAPRQSRKERE